MAFCGKCGAYIAEGSNVCPACGKRVGAAQAERDRAEETSGAAKQTQHNREYRHAYRQNGNENGHSGQTRRERTYTYNNYTNRGPETGARSGFISGPYPWVALLSYFSVLFVVPYFLRNDNDFARFHANQGLLLLLLGGISGVLEVLPVIGWLLSAVCGLFTAVCFFMGISNVINRRFRELPLIGWIRLLK